MRRILRRILERIGLLKHRQIKLTTDIPGFDEAFYLEFNPDVGAARINPKVHYLAHGREEGRPGNAVAYVRKFVDAEFDPAVYLQLNLDVAQAALEPGRHFLEHGRKEGRLAKRISQIEQRDVVINDGVAASLTTKTRSSPTAGLTCGAEVPSHIAFSNDGSIVRGLPRFDAGAYFEDNPDVAAALPRDAEILAKHWIEHGFFENRPGYGLPAYADRAMTRAFWRKKPTITCYGLFDAPSGLGAAARLYRDAFIQAGFEVDSVTVTERYGRFLTEPEVRGSFARGESSHSRVNFYILNADMMDIFFLDDRRHLLDESYNIAVWYWELAHFPAEWLNAFGPLDEIWVASEFCKKAISPLSPVPVYLIPPPVNSPIEKPVFPRTYFGIPDNIFVFGSIFDVGSTLERKNPGALVRAFRAAFEDREDVCLVLKYHGAHHYPSAIQRLHSLAAGASNIRFFGTVMGDEEIASFRATLDCFVSPHRSEGFGFNLAEALLLKKPVVATDYSGSRDFLTLETGYPIEYNLVEIGKQLGPYPAAALWADPDEDVLANALISVFFNQDEATKRAANGCNHILRKYSLKSCAQRIRIHIEKLGVFAGSPVELPTWGAGRRAARQRLIRGPIRFTAIVSVLDAPAEMLANCVNSFIDQTYADWELILVDVGSRSHATIAALDGLRSLDARLRIISEKGDYNLAQQMNQAVEISSSTFLVFTQAETVLSPEAMNSILESVNTDDCVDLIYCDNDQINIAGTRVNPNFKPDWSPEYLESEMYMTGLLVVRRSHLLDLGGIRSSVEDAWLYDLALRASRTAHRITHIPKILYHTRPISNITQDEQNKVRSAERHALIDHLHASGRTAEVDPGLIPATYRARDVIPSELPVTLLIFTNNGSADIVNRGNINLFNHFFDSVISKTTSVCDFRILVADNGNLSPEQCLQVEQAGGHVISYVGPTTPFNFAKKANFAFRHVKTEYVILLNDDMEVITPGWVDALMEVAIRPGVGVVGAKLLFPDDSIQHSGMIFGIFGDVAHIFHGMPAVDIGHNGVTHLIRNYSAVTGACMATRMSLVRELGGFDENLAIDYNDVDFCLRAQEIGFRNVFTPFAELYHFEGKTAKRSVSTQTDQVLFRSRWSAIIANDPQYNPNLSRSAINFSPAT